MNADPYVSNQAEKSLLRTEDKSKFITTQVDSKDGKDFTRYIHHSEGKSKIDYALAKKKHPEVGDHEKVGPKWQNSTIYE
jgi:hypothetical protein